MGEPRNLLKNSTEESAQKRREQLSKRVKALLHAANASWRSLVGCSPTKQTDYPNATTSEFAFALLLCHHCANSLIRQIRLLAIPRAGLVSYCLHPSNLGPWTRCGTCQKSVEDALLRLHDISRTCPLSWRSTLDGCLRSQLGLSVVLSKSKIASHHFHVKTLVIVR